MAVVDLMKRDNPNELKAFLEGVSIEVMPRTAAKIDDFKALLPENTRIYIAHIEGTPYEEMLATAKRLTAEGFSVMPHVPSRMIKDLAMLDERLGRYHDEAGVTQALVLAGGPAKLVGPYESSMQILETGLFQKHGFKRLHVAGHPEGNPDIDADGTTRNADAALQWKQAFAKETGVEMAIVTQFAFDAHPVIDWATRLADIGISLPIHVGVAGPAKLQTLIKFAIACGVGPSLGVLQKRAKDLSKLLRPIEPTGFLTDLARHKAANPESLIEKAHVFPLGGIQASATWIADKSAG